MDTTILGIVALVIGAIWKAFPWAKQVFVKGTADRIRDIPLLKPTAGESMSRLEALRYAELVLQYLEQNGLDDGQEPLRQVVEVLFTTPEKE
jgi:hypothetical protein